MDAKLVLVAALVVCLGLTASLAWVHFWGGASWALPEWFLAPIALMGVGVFIGSEGWASGQTLAAVCTVAATVASLLGEPTWWVRSSLVVMGWAWIACAVLVWLGGMMPWGPILSAAGSLGTGLLLRPARERLVVTPNYPQESGNDEWGASSPSEPEVSDW